MQHRKGDGEADQKGVAKAHRQEDDQEHQDQAGVDIVLEVGDHHFDIPGFVENLGDFGALRPLPPFGGDDFIHLLADGDDILAGALLDRQIHRIPAVQPGDAGLFLKPVDDLGHIFQIDRFALMGADHQAVDLFRGLEFAGNPQLKTALTEPDDAARGVLVLALTAFCRLLMVKP